MTSATNHIGVNWIGGVLSAAIVIGAVVLGALVLREEADHPRTDDCEIVANYIGIAPQVEGKFASAFVRAKKPAAEEAALNLDCCGPTCCSSVEAPKVQE